MNGTCSRGWTCRRQELRDFLAACPFATPLTPEGRALTRAAGAGARRHCRRRKLAGRRISTQAGFGDILAEIGRGQGELKELAEHIVTTART